MKIFLYLFVILLTTLSLSASLKAQDSIPRKDKFYTMSGFGFSFPIGESSEFMRPKFSTTIGVNLGIGNAGFFFYPKISLHVFGYDNTILNNTYSYNLDRARSTTYLLNVAMGYRKIINKFGFYGFVGGGGGFILTPRLAVNSATNQATLNNRTNHMGIIEPGAGIEYNIGGASLFVESSYMHGIGKVGDKPFNAVPVTIGIKPNLSRIFKKPK